MQKYKRSDFPLNIDGQKFRLVGTAKKRTSRGRTVEVLEIETCCHTCGSVFWFNVPGGGGYLSRRCEEHKQPGIAAVGSPLWLRKMQPPKIIPAVPKADPLEHDVFL